MDNNQPSNFNPNYKLFNVLAYIGILFVVGLIVAPNDPRCKHHLNNGILLFLIGLVSGAIAAVPILGWIIAPIVGIISFIAAIKGIIDAVNDKEEPLLVFGKFLKDIKIFK